MLANGPRGCAMLAAALFLGGCGATTLRDEPPAFVAAFHDGCMIGYAMALPDPTYWLLGRKDEARYATDEVYRRGWDYGYEECFMDATLLGGESIN